MPLDLHTNSDASLYEIMQAFVTALAVINLEVCGLIFFDADAKADMGAKMTDSRQGRRVYCLRCLHHLSFVTLSSKIGERRWS